MICNQALTLKSCQKLCVLNFITLISCQTSVMQNSVPEGLLKAEPSYSYDKNVTFFSFKVAIPRELKISVFTHRTYETQNFMPGTLSPLI